MNTVDRDSRNARVPEKASVTLFAAIDGALHERLRAIRMRDDFVMLVGG